MVTTRSQPSKFPRPPSPETAARAGRTANYDDAFNLLTDFAEHARRVEIPAAEYSVTSTLAGPFEKGGLLVLLQEPLLHHPWGKGVDAVINGCATLSCLDEALQIVSSGDLSLTDGVSLLDVRAFIPKELNKILLEADREELYEWITEAVYAKQPDVILCMGKQAQNVLAQHRHGSFFLPPEFWKRTTIVYADHPSHWANYNRLQRTKQTALLRGVAEAHAHLTNQRWNPRAWDAKHLDGGLFVPAYLLAGEGADEPSAAADADCAAAFLAVLARKCFPGAAPPQLNLGKGDWYATRAVASGQDAAGKALAAVFGSVSEAIVRVSWFLPVYYVYWSEVVDAFAAGPADLEDVLLQGTGVASGGGRYYTSARRREVVHTKATCLALMRRVVAASERGVESSPSNRVSTPRYSRGNGKGFEREWSRADSVLDSPRGSPSRYAF